MSDSRNNLVERLSAVGLTRDEAKIYLELLNGPSTHLRLARITGINRTTVYRLADQLENRSIITKRIDDRGMALVAGDPITLEVELIAQEEELNRKRVEFKSLIPQLKRIRSTRPDFVVNTYAGDSGFKQMLWNELKTKGELLSFGGCSLETLIDSRRWVERYREKVVSARYTMRELVNGDSIFENFTQHQTYLDRYFCRCISPNLIMLGNIITIYNDTVSTYRWDDDNKKIGVEMIDASHAYAMRQIFETYWKIAEHGAA